jgi:hypothetical protein
MILQDGMNFAIYAMRDDGSTAASEVEGSAGRAIAPCVRAVKR